MLKNYFSQPSTWLGLAKLGAAIGLYSTGIGGAIASAIMGIFGVVDVVRNENPLRPLRGVLRVEDPTSGVSA